MDDQKRFITAMVLSGLILGAYYFFIAGPASKEAQRQAAEEMAKTAPAQMQVVAPEPMKDRAQLITEGTRIQIDTPSLSGSFSTTGSRFDDLRLKNYNETIKKDSETVALFTPEGAERAAYVFDNWTTADGGSGASNEWAVISGGALGVSTPVTLEFSDTNYTVRRVISIDENYLITLDDTVTNTSAKEISLVRKGAARQHGLPRDLTNFFIIQEGPVAVADKTLNKMKYKKLSKKKTFTVQGESGWAGLTDRFWLTAAIAPQGQQMSAHFGSNERPFWI